VAAIDQVGNDASESVEFSLAACTRLRVYAMGEGTAQGMKDLGYVENAASGQIVWQMHFFETEAAGAYRNRRVDRILTLPAGDYRLRFQTDGAHAFEDWGDQAPGNRFWGIALYEDRSPDHEPAACWERVERPEVAGWSSEALKRLGPDLGRMGVAALMVVTDGQVVFEWGNTANNFQAHSMRKSLMSALYGIYVAEGVIDTANTLEELGIDDIVPLTSREKQATVADLLKAQSGVYVPAAGEASSMKAERPKRGSHRPGSHWYYNNWDFNTLGTIFEQETGQNIYQAFDARIGDPVGMQDFFPERLGYTYEYWLSQHPYYGFRISARDLARFGQLFLQGGAWQGNDSPNAEQIVPAAWVEESTQSHSRTDKSGTYSGYGYMWWIASSDYQGIPSGSYAASGYGGHTLEILPDLNTVIVFRPNTDAIGFQPIKDEDGLVLRVLEAMNR
jgi:CubicO group peptidase (beta-lactamase class C family)